MRARPVPRNWVSGELAPWLDGIPGEVTGHGALTLENFVVKKQGAIQRRPGSFYVSEVKNTLSQTILIQCEIDSDNIYVLEMGNLYCRFYKNHIQVSLAASAYEVTTPYSTGDLTDLRWCYIPNEKALYFAHPRHPVQQLEWTSDNSWTLARAEIQSAPAMMWVGGKQAFGFTKNLKSWTREANIISTIDPYSIRYIGFDEKTNTYIAVGDSIDSGSATVWVLNTIDYGKTWTDVTPSTLTSLSCPTNITNNGRFWVLPAEKRATVSSHTIYISSDGVIFTPLVQSTTLPANCAYAKSNRRTGYVRVFGNNQWTYGDGVNSWATVKTIGVASANIYAMDTNHAASNAVWVAVGRYTSTGSAAIWTSSSDTGAMSTLTVPMSGIAAFATVCYGEPNGVPMWVIPFGTDIFISSTGATFSYYGSTGLAIQFGNDLWWNGSYFFSSNSSTILKSQDGLAWTLEYPLDERGGYVSFSDISGDRSWWNDEFLFPAKYPACVTYHQGRLFLGPTETKPASVWGSKTNDLLNFGIGEYADDAFTYDLVSDRNVDIRWMMGGNELAIGTRTAEGVLAGSTDEGITPSSAHMQWQSSFGSDNIQPIRIHDTIIFTQRGGEIVRGYVPAAGSDAWKSPDLTAFADHIARGGITEIDHQDDPQTVAHFVRADGYGLGLTFEGTTRAWWRTKMGASSGGFGVIESLCVIPTSGAEDEIWAVVKWTVGGSVRRFIVYFDAYNFGTKEGAHFVDCGYENAACASATVYASVLPQLAGESVDALINGSTVEKGLVVGVGGTLTIAATNALTLHAGLPYTSYAQTMRIDQNSGWGSGLGLSKRLGNLNVWVHQTIGGKFGPTSSITEAVAYTSTADLTTDCLSVNFPGQWDRDGYIWCIQDDPLPMTVVAVAPDMEMGDR